MSIESTGRCTSYYKTTHGFESRCAESLLVRSAHPKRIPVLVERSPSASAHTPLLNNVKFLPQADCTVHHLLGVLRSRIVMPSAMAIFVFVGDVSPSGSVTLADLDAKYRDDDGFLYLKYSVEETQG